MSVRKVVVHADFARSLGAAVAIGVGIAGIAGAAVAQSLPSWAIAAVCAKEAGYCEESEARARQVVSGSWDVLPSAYRSACLKALSSADDRSWRLLAQCLEDQTLAGLDKREIKTAVTPVEPEPPPARPAVVPPAPVGGVPQRGPSIAAPAAANSASSAPADVPGMPAPPFGVPTAPPRIQ